MFDDKAKAPLVQRRKILLVALRPSVQGLVSTFLVSMGCTCVIVSNEEAPSILEKEVFDAVLLDQGFSDARADTFMFKLKQMSPSLAGRVAVISDTVVNRQTIELVERHDLLQLSEERLLPQLWASLQELFNLRRSWQHPLRKIGVPRKIFDSFRSGAPAGIRSVFPGARHLAYQYKSTVIDLSITSPQGTRRTAVAGQLLDGERKSLNDGLSVLLASGVETVARTATNQFGEFHLEFETTEPVSLEIRLDDRSWLLVPLGKMECAGKAASLPRQ